VTKVPDDQGINLEPHIEADISVFRDGHLPAFCSEGGRHQADVANPGCSRTSNTPSSSVSGVKSRRAVGIIFPVGCRGPCIVRSLPVDSRRRPHQHRYNHNKNHSRHAYVLLVERPGTQPAIYRIYPIRPQQCDAEIGTSESKNSPVKHLEVTTQNSFAQEQSR
jgi:hypothetical protein